MNMKLTILTTAALLTTTNLSAIATAENLQHIQQLLSTKQCQQCDLSGAGLVVADLAGAKLSGADLSRANLSRANLMGADLTGANLSGASLNGANLSGANLSGANLGGTDLRDAFLANAQLFGTSLNTAYVQGAIGIPQYAGTPEDFYAWGVGEANRGNYKAAIEFYNQALILKPDFAPAFLARGVARFNLGDPAGATQDAQKAGDIFNVQGNPVGYQTSQDMIRGIEIAQNPPKARSGTSLGNAIVGVGSLLFRLLSPF
jgi:tetratricopeptide (TPR) repeat protein